MSTLTQNIAKEINENENEVIIVREYDSFVIFKLNGYGTEFAVNLTKTGKVKKNSLRRSSL